VLLRLREGQPHLRWAAAAKQEVIQSTRAAVLSIHGFAVVAAGVEALLLK
jgi:hypothetical protein